MFIILLHDYFVVFVCTFLSECNSQKRHLNGVHQIVRIGVLSTHGPDLLHCIEMLIKKFRSYKLAVILTLVSVSTVLLLLF